MSEIRGGAEIMVGGVNIKEAVLAEHIGAVAEGPTNTGLNLCGKSPGGGVGAGVEMVDVGFGRANLRGICARDVDAGEPNPTADIRRHARIVPRKTDNQVTHDDDAAHVEGIVERLLAETAQARGV